MQILVAALVALLCSLLCSSASAFVDADGARGGSLPQMTFYHRFSPQAKVQAELSGASWVVPTLNSAEHYKMLVHRDLIRHGRNLATAPSSLTFVLGNLTTISNDGLFYSLVSVGTPSVSYFVALDSGSDLFWLPCECNACAPPSSPYFEGIPSLNYYAPSQSNSSEAVACSNSSCSSDFSTCRIRNVPNSGQCQYTVEYAAVNTSSSGTVYEDVIRLMPNDGSGGTDITARIALGCGQTQTGTLVDGTSVPDGLMGLGPRSYSVPSVLAQSGLVVDSFSMCFSEDLSGRIVFGDVGSGALTTTPFIENNASLSSHYNIGVDSVRVGNQSIPVNEASFFDTGTTATFLTSTVYNAVIASFTSQVTRYTRIQFDGTFEVCYQTSNRSLYVPGFTFEFSGGASLRVLIPVVPYFYTNLTLAGFCLAVLDGGSINIVGVDSMTGYNFVFNRQNGSLGFERSDCYTSSTSSSTLSPAVSPVQAPSSGSTPRPSVVSLPIGGQGAPGPGPSAGQENAAPQRLSFPLPSILLMGVIVNCFLQWWEDQI